jgi:hypothetical protein
MHPSIHKIQFSHWPLGKERRGELIAAMMGVVYGLALMPMKADGAYFLAAIPAFVPRPDPDAYTLTYVVDGSPFWKEYAGRGAMAAGPLNAPAPPDGKHFIGWFAEGRTKPLQSGIDPVNANATLYARFSVEPLPQAYFAVEGGGLSVKERSAARMRPGHAVLAKAQEYLY